MKVYVTGSSRDCERVHEVQTVVAARGHEITYDWVKDVLAERREVRNIPFFELEPLAIEDANGVARADAVIVVAHPRWTGALVEIGMALAWGIPVYAFGVSGTYPFSIFWAMDGFDNYIDLHRLIDVAEEKYARDCAKSPLIR